MPDFGASFLILAFAIFGAGAIRGFAGFGDALFFLPLGSLVLEPVQTIMVFMMVAMLGPIPLLPKAWSDAPRKEAIGLMGMIALFLPPGFWLLTKLDPVIFKTTLSIIAICVVILMALGIHPKFRITPKSAAILGAVSGFIGGFTGVPGTLLMFVLLNSQLRSKDVRALSLLTLFSFDMTLFLLGAGSGFVNMELIKIAAILLPLYVAGSFLGQKVFNPEKEDFFRTIALIAIFLSGVFGLPFFAQYA